MEDKICPVCLKPFKVGGFVRLTFVRRIAKWPEFCNDCLSNLEHYIEAEIKRNNREIV